MSTECTYKIKINSIYKDDQRKNYIEFTCFTLSEMFWENYLLFSLHMLNRQHPQ